MEAETNSYKPGEKALLGSGVRVFVEMLEQPNNLNPSKLSVSNVQSDKDEFHLLHAYARGSCKVH